MGNRTEAVWRVLGLVYFVVIGWIVLTIAGIAAIIWMVVDVLMQLVTGREGWSGSTSGAGGFLKRIWDWGHGQLNWVLFGSGEFPILP